MRIDFKRYTSTRNNCIVDMHINGNKAAELRCTPKEFENLVLLLQRGADETPIDNISITCQGREIDTMQYHGEI